MTSHKKNLLSWLAHHAKQLIKLSLILQVADGFALMDEQY
jgi:hypothetical protein